MRTAFLPLSACVASVALLGHSRPAVACSFAAPDSHVVDPGEAAVDDTPPSAPTDLAVTQILRGTGPTCDASGVCASTSCDDIGQIALSWTTGTDDRTAPEQLGVVVRVVEGSAPDFPLHDEPFWPLEDGSHAIIWGDGATDDQEPLDFVIELAHIDLAGNESDPVQVHITHAGGTARSGGSAGEAGCSVMGAASGGWSLLVALGLCARSRRSDGLRSPPATPCLSPTQPPPEPPRSPDVRASPLRQSSRGAPFKGKSCTLATATTSAGSDSATMARSAWK